MPILTPFQKKALLVEKTKAASTLARKHPALAKEAAQLAPATSKMRLRKINALRGHVSGLKNQLETQALNAEAQSRVEYSLGVSADQLQKLTAQSARHRALSRSRITGTYRVTQADAKKKEYVLRAQMRSAQSQLQSAAHSFKNGNASHRHQAATRLTLLHATIASLTYRLRILRKGLAVRDSPVIDSHSLQHQLTALALPRMFKAPDRSDAAVAVRLIASNRPRREEESEDQYRATLKAYLKRALLRTIHKQHLDNGTAIMEGVTEAMNQDGAAIEQAAKLGGVPADELGNMMDAAVQDSAREIEQAVIDFQPSASEVVRKGVIRQHSKEAVDAVLAQAAQESAALAVEDEEPLDELIAVAPDGALAIVAAKPFYMKKEFLIPAAIAIAALLVIRR